ncbi:hypothetical protein CIL05_07450 [Virgibacillus profundi]|uniref:Single-stranded DNA-binding protein n=1 Tax=Virgibacillus profundi TaxID=2024555 RepID=A0A2A2IG54_9BACI|nr:hypothetical protein [Virgibacillus profundi]PAV30296.1 hypothetical protein CIL05_07450 [Virgibacillus profundi]PXY54468.1 hypothetical protein CIT14_07535 [Virgibacillus profundi]
MTTENNGNTTIREAKNIVTVEGLLLEMESREGTSAAGKDFLSAKLTVATNEEKTEQHVIELFSMKLKADGNVNGIYSSLKTVVDEYKSVAQHGDQADYVRTTTGKIALNDYVGGDGQLKSFPQISATFVNRLDAGEEPNYHAGFETELVVSKVVEEINQDEEETGRVKLGGYIPLYGGKVIPFEFVVNEDGSPYVLDNYENGDTVFVYGDIINFKEKTVKTIESAFGADKQEVNYKTTRSWTVSGGVEPYEEDNVNTYNVDAIKKALAEREVYLEGLKEKKKKGGEKKKGGFDTKSKTKKKSGAASIDQDSLPF